MNSKNAGRWASRRLTVQGCFKKRALQRGRVIASAIDALESRTLLSSVTLLANFNTTNGDEPVGIIAVSGSTIYGVTQEGGSSEAGVLYTVPLAGGTPSDLVNFTGGNGGGPDGGVIVAGSTIYGTTEEGGSGSNAGEVFAESTAGGTPTVSAFNGTDGLSPTGSLLLSNNTLYGVSLGIGNAADGEIYSVPIGGGTPTVLATFNGSNNGPTDPNGGLVLSGGTLYGTTSSGGTNGDGTVFSIPVGGGTATVLYSFDGTHGSTPNGDLILSGSNLIGTTNGGGANLDGDVFSIPTSGGTPTLLGSFDGANSGKNPNAGVILSGSTLFGTTDHGTATADAGGVIFSLPLAGGTPTALVSFNGTDANGDAPGPLTLMGSTLYGTTEASGENGEGSVFSLALPSNNVIVTNTNNSGPGSLPAAIATADASGAPTTITFDPTVFATPQIITLNGTDLDLSNTTEPITITGPSAGVTISGNQASRIFQLDANVTAIISNVTVTDGSAPIGGGIYTASGSSLTMSNSTISNNDAVGNSGTFGDGAGIYAAGTINLTSVTITGNQATSANTSGGNFSDGGGILVYTSGSATLTSCTVSNNTVSADGAGIDAEGNLTLTNCTINHNTAVIASGGVGNNGTLIIDGTTISNNSAEEAAGVYVASGSATMDSDTFTGNTGEDAGAIQENGNDPLTVTNSTFTNNVTTDDGGAFWLESNTTFINDTISGNSTTGDGGAFFLASSNATFTLTNDTISNNSATVAGGGIFNGGAAPAIQTPTGSLTLGNTIVAGNSAPTDPDVDDSVAVTSNGHNLIGKIDGSSGWIASDLTGTVALPLNALLAPLGSYGGPTQTMALLPGSPAIDAGSNALALDASGKSLTTDQRGIGFARVVNSTVDIGAYESEGFTIKTTGGTSQSATVGSAFATPLGVQVTSNNTLLTNLAGGTVTFTAPSTGASATFGANPVTLAANGTGSATATANSTAGGPYNVTATASGIATAAQFSLTNTSSSVAPTVTLTAPANGSSTNNNKPTLSGTASTDAADSTTVTVKIYSGSSTSGTLVQTLATTESGGIYSIAPTTALADGTYTAQASQSNTSSQTGTSSANTFTVDTVAPIVTLTAPANNSSTGTTTPTFSGAAGTASGDSSTITVKIYPGSVVTGSPVQTLTTTASGGSYSVAPSAPLELGTYTAVASQSDAAGNTGTSSANTFSTNSATTPAVTLTSPANGSSTNNNKPTFSGAAGTVSGDSSTITIKIFSGNSTSGTLVQTLTATQSGGTYSIAPTTALVDGTYTAQASQSNTDSNIGTSTANTFTVDTVAPIVTLTSPANGGSTGTTSPTFTGAAGTASGDSSTITVKIYPGSVVSGSPVQTLTTTASGGSYSVAPSAPLELGTYTAVASQSDAAGNIGTSSANTFTTNAATTPAVTLTSPTNGSSTNNNKPTFSGVAGTASGDSSTITIKIYSGSSTSGTLVQTLTATQSGGTYSIAPTTALADGTYMAQANQSNTDSNIGTSTANTFTVDTVAPTVTLTSPANGGSTGTTSPTFTGAAGTASGDSSTITVKIYPGSVITGSPVQTLTTTASGGSYSVAPSAPLEQGTYTAVASQSDAAGNTGTSSANTFTISTSQTPGTGSLTGTSSTAATNYNLTSLGTSDWADFGVGGNTSFVHKATGGSQISNVTRVGSATFGGFNDPNRNLSWTDGTPIASDGDDHGFLWVNNGLNAGYTFTAPADTTTRTLFIYLGGFSSGATLTAHLSDGTANDFTATYSSSDKYNELVAITYKAGSAGQTLVITYTKTSNVNGTNGSADLMAAWLGGAQTAPVNTAPQVTTNPKTQSITAGQTVTFTASANGNPAPTVQWQVSTDGGKTFTNIPGATSTTYSFTASIGQSGDEYLAVFTNSVNYGITSAATLTVTPASAPATGSLSGTSSTAAASYNLTTLGTSDWAHFGTGGNATGFDHKATGGSQISNVTRVGSGTFGGFNDPNRSVSWTDGTPDAKDTGDEGFLWANNGIGAGYSFTAPADTTSRTIYVYLGGYSSGATLTAHLSDGSAADYVTSFSSSGKYNDVVAITYKAASAGQNLVLTYVKSQNINGTGGSADLMAAWLG
jgi:uncharacterized repeat protein (TIGR03803 family)